MGASIDLAVSSFEIVEKNFYKGKIVLDFYLNEQLYFDMLSDYDSFELYSGSYGDIVPYFDLQIEESISDIYIPYYKKESLFFIDYLLNLKNETWLKSDLYNCLLLNIDTYGKENLFISVDLCHFYILNGWSKFSKKVYKGNKFLPITEDGKLLLRALDNLELYNFKLPNIQIYYDDYSNTEVNSNDNYEKLIHFDSRVYVSDFENFLKSVVKNDDDEFFDERYKRWLIILEHLKHGVKYVYSV